MGAARELFEDNSVYTGREVKRMLELVPADGGREVGTTEVAADFARQRIYGEGRLRLLS